jgi:16S rRNA G966 N2-methylase RsmD
MVNKLVRFYKYPFYRKIDCLKDYFYQFKSYFFLKTNKLEISDGNLDNNIINKYNEKNINFIFQNSSYYYCKRMINCSLKRNVKYKNFIDIGSGKGKICFEVASNYKFESIIGIEYDTELFLVSQNNLRKLNNNKIEFINDDILNYNMPDSPSIIFLFNSFNEFVLRKFLKRNIYILRQHKSILLYRHDIYANVLEEFNAKLIEKDLYRKDSIWLFE